MSSLKQTNIRLDEESADKFRKLCDDMNFNQTQGFEYLLSTLELYSMADVVPGRKDDIEAFNSTLTKIQTAYRYSIELAVTADERANERYTKELQLRDDNIENLKEKIREQERIITELKTEAEAASKKASDAEKSEKHYIDKATAAEEVTKETRKVNEMLTSKLADAETKLDGYDALKQAENSLKTEVAKLTRDIEEMHRSFKQEKELVVERAVREKELAVEKAIRETEKEFQDRIESLQENKLRLQIKLEMLAENNPVSSETELGKTVPEDNAKNK